MNIHVKCRLRGEVGEQEKQQQQETNKQKKSQSKNEMQQQIQSTYEPSLLFVNMILIRLMYQSQPPQTRKHCLRRHCMLSPLRAHETNFAVGKRSFASAKQTMFLILFPETFGLIPSANVSPIACRGNNVE